MYTRVSLHCIEEFLLLPTQKLNLNLSLETGETFTTVHRRERGSADALDRLLPVSHKSSAIFISVGNCLVYRQHQQFLMRGMGM